MYTPLSASMQQTSCSVQQTNAPCLAIQKKNGTTLHVTQRNSWPMNIAPKRKTVHYPLDRWTAHSAVQCNKPMGTANCMLHTRPRLCILHCRAINHTRQRKWVQCILQCNKPMGTVRCTPDKETAHCVYCIVVQFTVQCNKPMGTARCSAVQ